MEGVKYGVTCDWGLSRKFWCTPREGDRDTTKERKGALGLRSHRGQREVLSVHGRQNQHGMTGEMESVTRLQTLAGAHGPRKSLDLFQKSLGKHGGV